MKLQSVHTLSTTDRKLNITSLTGCKSGLNYKGLYSLGFKNRVLKMYGCVTGIKKIVGNTELTVWRGSTLSRFLLLVNDLDISRQVITLKKMTTLLSL